MFDRIIYISDDSCSIKMKDDTEITMNLMNLHLVFEDDTKKILGEVDDLDDRNDNLIQLYHMQKTEIDNLNYNYNYLYHVLEECFGVEL